MAATNLSVSIDSNHCVLSFGEQLYQMRRVILTSITSFCITVAHSNVADCNKNNTNLKGFFHLARSANLPLPASHVFTKNGFMDMLLCLPYLAAERHRGNVHLTSPSLVSARCHGYVNSVKYKIKFYHECKLSVPCAQCMLQPMHSTNFSK